MNDRASYIVTTSARGASRRQIWKPEEPLKIGFPMQWMVESTGEGVRITYLGGKAGAISKDRVREIPFSRLKTDPLIVLEAGEAGPEAERGGARSPIELRIEPASATAPAFAQPSRADSSREEQILGVYRTHGNWVVEAHRVEKDFVGRASGTRVFTLHREGRETRLVPHASGVRIVRQARQGAAAQELPKEGLKLAPAELADSILVFGNSTGSIASWRFGWMAANPAAVTKIQRLPVLDLSDDAEAPAFKKQLRNVAIGLVALLALSLLWPKPKPEELIPPQLAKIILTPPKHLMAHASESAPATATASQKKVQQTAVVQAFRAKALQSAVSQLMKGGMTRLLEQSDFIAGHRQSAELGRILDTQSKDLRDLSPKTGGLDTKNLAVASLGGDGVGGKNGKSVGYGKGEHASVGGQGKAFVSMDIADSQVDEGLTKDQVGEVIHRHLSEVRYCYESAMIRTPDIEGKLVVDFTIGGNGVVKTADAKESTLPVPRLDDCILRRLATWQFPEPRGHVDVAVTYPFIFKTLGR